MARRRSWPRSVSSMLVAMTGIASAAVPCLAQSGSVARVAQTPQTPQPGAWPSNAGPAAEVPTFPTTPDPNLAPLPDSNLAPSPMGSGGSNFFSQAMAGTASSEGIAPANSTLGGAGGYIENAIPRSQIRTRYDLVGGVNHPDRAQYFWAGFSPATVGALSYQEIHNWVEYAPRPDFSVFFDAPVRFLHLPNTGPGTHQENYGGFGDLQLGFKYAFVARPDVFKTFQFKTYVPTGDARAGLGTGHASFEPSLLLFRQVSDRFFLIGQFTDWIPIGSLNYSPNVPAGFGPNNWSGNVLSYGIGGFYNLFQNDHFRFAPTLETIGWTCLSGRTGLGPASANTTESATGETIVNMKVGARFGIGDYLTPGGASPLNDRLSLYAGYARSVTGDVWYKNMFRLELTVYF